MKLSKVIDLFLLSVRADGLSDQTEAWYRNRLARLLAFVGELELQQITVDDLRRFVVSLRDQSVKYEVHRFHKPVKGALSEYTVDGYVRVIRRLFHWLEENGHLPVNVAARLKKPGLPKLPPKAVDIDDIRALLEAAQFSGKYSARDRAIVLFLADTGCRKGGLISLKLRDLHVDKCCALVTEKGRKARYVFFSSATKHALEAWLVVRPDRCEEVFMGQRGCLGDFGVNEILGRLKSRAGVRGRVYPHGFRHWFAKTYLTNGGDLASLADLMGHSTVEVTKQSYAVFLTEELQRKHQMHDVMAELLATEQRRKRPLVKGRQAGKAGKKQKPLKKRGFRSKK